MNIVGPSTAMAPSAAIWPKPALSPRGSRSMATSTVATIAAITPTIASSVWTR